MGFLGVDTSCYTTSVAYLADGQLVEKRKLLSVPQGKRGLRQSEALFQHLGNLPLLLEELSPQLGRITHVAASTRPRPQEDSYLPVFKAGETVARSIAASLNCPFIETSHQAGHLWAGFWSAKERPQENWLAFHLSGGTTDLLLVRPKVSQIETLGSSLDLHAGQFIDRVGVHLGLSFPAGPSLEKLAREGQRGKITIPAPVRGYDLSFGGPEAAACRELERGADPGDLALAVILTIGRGVVKVITRALEEYQISSLLFVGGVAANQILRDYLREKLEHPKFGVQLFFADPHLSTDNAVGVAVAAREATLWKD